MGLHDFGVHQLQAQSFNKNSRNPMIFTFYFKPTLSFVILCKKKIAIFHGTFNCLSALRKF